MDLPPHLVDKRIQRAEAIARAAREELLRSGAPAAGAKNPLEGERPVSSKATYLELGERPKDPITDAQRAWSMEFEHMKTVLARIASATESIAEDYVTTDRNSAKLFQR